MRCPSCEFENPEGMNFCGKCASPLSPRCPQCGFENPPGFAFCGKCAAPLTARQKEQRGRGAGGKRKKGVRGSESKPIAYTPKHLAERILAEQAAREARGAQEGERKTITALFADIKGSMDLIEDLDPEDARSLIDPAPGADDGCCPPLRGLRGPVHRRWHLCLVWRAHRP